MTTSRGCPLGKWHGPPCNCSRCAAQSVRQSNHVCSSVHTKKHVPQALNQASCGGRCAIGSGGKSVGYLAHGTATDYMYDKLHVPLSFTWEIFGDDKAPYDDCFRMFNPLSKQHVDAVVEQWVTAAFMLLELLPQHPAIPHIDTAVLGEVATAGYQARLPGAQAHIRSAGYGKPGTPAGYVSRQTAGHAMAALHSFEVR